MIILALLFLALLVGVFEFFIFRQRSKYKKILTQVEELNLDLGIFRSLSYLLQSNQSLQDDWNQLANILSAQNIYALPSLEQFLNFKTNQESIISESNDPKNNFTIAIDNFVKLLTKKHELNKKLTPQQQRKAVSVKW